MAKRVILAVAGAGKTYHICNSIKQDEKNLILAYTHANIQNIKNELIKLHGAIPKLTTVMTFDSFIYRFLLCPYEPTILRFFQQETFISKGITMRTPPAQTLKNNSGAPYKNPKYVKKDKLEHYFAENGQYYCSNISELIMTVKENKKSLIKKAVVGLNSFYDQVMIDEFQDFREYDYEVVIALAKEMECILLVGDYHQHSVSAINNSGKPFKKRKTEVSYEEFKEILKEAKLEVDEETLKASRRCPREICNYVKAKLEINISADNNNQGHVIWVKDQYEKILEDDSITKLIFNNSDKYRFNAVNWSYSKGDTMKNVCVILTENFEKLNCDNFVSTKISTSTINKLYVAMTRTEGNLYLIKSEDFKSIKKKFQL